MKKNILLTLSIIFLFFNGNTLALSAENYELSVQDYNHGVVPLNAVRLPLMSVIVQAKRNISVSEIDLHRSGLSSWDDFGNIWAETDSYISSLRGRLNSDDYARIKFRSPINIAQGASEKFTIYINLELTNAGNTFNFSLENIRISNQNHAKLSRYSRFRNYRGKRRSSENFSRVSQYKIPSLEFSSLGTSSKIQIGQNAEVGKFRLFNSGKKDIFLKFIRFKNYGKSDLEKDFDKWRLLHNGIEISTEGNVSKNMITFDLKDYILKAGDAMIIEIESQLIYGRQNHTIQLGIQYPSDIIGEVRNTDTNAAIKIKSSKLKKYSLGNGDFKFIQTYYQNLQNYNRNRPTDRNNKTSNYSYTNSRTSYAPGSKDVLFLHKYFHEKYDFRAEGIFIPLVSSQNQDSLENSYNDFRLYIDGNLAGNTNDFEEKNGQLGLFFNNSFEAGKRGEVRVIGRISHNASNGDSLSLNLHRATIFDKSWLWQ